MSFLQFRGIVFIMISFAFGQTVEYKSISTLPSAKIKSSLKEELINWSTFTFNQKMYLNQSSKTLWFYHLGAYNDLWGSDISNFPQLNNVKNISLFSKKNNPLNIATIGNQFVSSNKYTYLTVFGFPVKKLAKTYSGYNFYGSERNTQ